VVFNYFYGIQLSRDYRADRANPRALAIGIAVNLAVLAYFKYTNFFIDNANSLLGTHTALQQIVLPLGISFFTFQKIAYLVDAYRGEAEEYDFLDFSLFVMYFPQLIAGPIVHHKEMIRQFRQASLFELSPTDLAAGLTLFTIGLIKKIGIADMVVAWSDPVFAAAAAGAQPSFIEAWSGALCFTFQIYFDFSGYTDMALGLALMIGIRLPLNFDSPYKATNMIDFWRRWHMSLSRFLRDYVYFPIGGNRRGSLRRYANLLLTMLIGGLWHGAAWTFVVWGGLHGIFLIINHCWQGLRSHLNLGSKDIAWRRWTARVITFIAVVAAWVLFRAESFPAASAILTGMIGRNGITLPGTYQVHLGGLAPMLGYLHVQFDDKMVVRWHGVREVAWLSVLLIVVWLLPNSQQLLARLRPALPEVRPARLAAALRPVVRFTGLIGSDGSLSLSWLTGTLVGSLLIGVMMYQAISRTSLQQFIYFQF
jgi:alginate O-acetyltransferase complex protein AlgI